MLFTFCKCVSVTHRFPLWTFPVTDCSHFQFQVHAQSDTFLLLASTAYLASRLATLDFTHTVIFPSSLCYLFNFRFRALKVSFLPFLAFLVAFVQVSSLRLPVISCSCFSARFPSSCLLFLVPSFIGFLGPRCFRTRCYSFSPLFSSLAWVFLIVASSFAIEAHPGS